MSKRSLRVPLISQQAGRPYCGAASAQMVLAYHGVRISQKRIVRDMRVLEGSGVDLVKMATYFARLGFQVKLVLWTSIWPPRFYRMPEAELRAALLRWSRRPVVRSYRFRRSCRRLFGEYFDAGGRIEARPVNVSDLRNALRRDEPPILPLDIATLWTTRKKHAHHFVVPVGMRGKNITLRDPNRSYGGTKTYPLEDVMHACHLNTSGALFIKPKR